MIGGIDDDRQRFDRRKVATVLLIIGVLLSGVAVAAHINNTISTSGDITLYSNSGLGVTAVGGADMLIQPQTFPTSNQVALITESGNATFTASGTANVSAQPGQLEGTYTNLTGIDADQYTITVDPDDKSSAVVGKEVDRFNFTGTIQAGDGTTDFSYTASANGRVTVQGLTANTRMAAFDKSTGNILDGATTSGSGQITFDTLNSGTHDAQIRTFTPRTPNVSSGSPTGKLDTPPSDLTVQVNDSDFPRSDTVDVTFKLDGNQIATKTITSNGTVSASVPSSGKTGGTHSWSANASDAYGEFDNQSYSYDVPKNISIHNESTSDIIKNKQIEVTIYSQGPDKRIYNYTTSNGKIDLGSGFPSQHPFIAVAEAPGYLDRRIYVENVYETQKLYMLNDTLKHTDIEFKIDDYSGNFPPGDTVLQVQRGIDGNWTTVLGDFFGANDQFVSQIRYNTRHRLVLTNVETGETKVLGSYTPLTSGTEQLAVSAESGISTPETHPTIDISPTTKTVPADLGVNFTVEANSGSLEMANWSVAVYHINATHNTTLYTDSAQSPGSITSKVDLTNKTGEVKVVGSYRLEGGAGGSEIGVYTIQVEPDTTMTLLDGLLATVGLVPNSDSNTVLSLTAMILTIAGTASLGTVFRMSTEMMGFVTLLFVAGFSVLGWFGYDLLFVTLVLFASIVFIRRGW